MDTHERGILAFVVTSRALVLAIGLALLGLGGFLLYKAGRMFVALESAGFEGPEVSPVWGFGFPLGFLLVLLSLRFLKAGVLGYWPQPSARRSRGWSD
ncbi:hypothetical protein [Nocardioides speluncae]|uniref:hypothetical protein n=1 Tax=Nocardioides speluncae TaxID=2670337 RepID=UPI000D68FD44|nr:hypothetical protein [Nocardioides speluncae]